MNPRQDGGSAFPQLTNDYIDRAGSFVSGVSGGMSLRDYFAGQALAGILQDRQHRLSNYVSDSADTAYQYADAMLAARETNARAEGRP